MNLSSDLISELVKVTSNKETKSKESTAYGTVVKYGDELYVKLDGSDLLTPMTSTSDVKDGDRVTIMIKNHEATITGNITSPSASKDVVEEINNKVVSQGNDITLIGNNITSINNTIIQQGNTINQQNNTITEIGNTIDSQNNKITEIGNTVDSQNNEITEINNKITSQNNKITEIDNEVTSQSNQITSIGNTVEAQDNSIKAINTNLESVNSSVGIYNSSFQVTDGVVTGIKGVDTEWIKTKDLETDHATIGSLDTKYANIDFANINELAVKKIFADSGIIKDLVVSEGHITGELVGVTIKGDLIEGGTVVADKLVVLGNDGLYYKLNTDGVSTTAEQTEYNSLNGSVITAKTITAEKVNVNDLVAFGATIGGFHITENAIYSGVKESVVNTTRGIYFNNDGEIVFGDDASFVKFYKDENEDYKLLISANSLSFGSEKKDVATEIENAQQDANDAQMASDANDARLTISESAIEQLSDAISMLITDENGSSMMTQTSTGWTFNISSIQDNLDKTANDLNDLSGSVDEVNNTITNLNSLVNDLSAKTAYIVMTTDDDGNPCIELGKEDNPFKVRITNTAVDFIENSSKVAYVQNNALQIEKAVVNNELLIGNEIEADSTIQSGFLWKRRSNGNLGLQYVQTSN